jgi:very-short-patch-repair endonuclease
MRNKLGAVETAHADVQATARQLRSKPTPAERHLEEALQATSLRFRRQEILHVFKNTYIADFYFPKARLILRIDDSSQGGERDAACLAANYRLMHVTSGYVINDTASLTRELEMACLIGNDNAPRVYASRSRNTLRKPPSSGKVRNLSSK